MPKNLTKPFLLILVFLVLVGCYLVFKPFLTEILMAAVLATIFYKPFEALAKFFKGHRGPAAFLMCVLLVLLVIIPATEVVIYGAGKSVAAYDETVAFFEKHDVADILDSKWAKSGPLKVLNLESLNLDNSSIRDAMLKTVKGSSSWLISGATSFVKGTTNFLISLILIIVTMFFFFLDGRQMLKHLMRLSPLQDKYDKEIFKKFREVSYSTFVSTFVASLSQGIVGAIGFAIVGFPVFLGFIGIAILSFLPYIGSAIFYVPISIYYILIGDLWRGIFVFVWGLLFIGVIDNVVRAAMIKGKAEINPIFAFFSILGGIALFGFWGVIVGPIIVAIAVTVFHIYELEFCGGEPLVKPEENVSLVDRLIEENLIDKDGK